MRSMDTKGESKVTGLIKVIESRAPAGGGVPERGLPTGLLSRVYMIRLEGM